MGLFRKLFDRDRPLSQDEFASHVAEQMRSWGWPDPTYDPATFVLKLSATESYGLHNIYENYLAAPKSERTPLLAGWFANLRARRLPDTFAEARDSLLPALRQRGESLRLLAQKNVAVDLVERPFSDDLVLGLAFDAPTATARVTKRQLALWSVDEELAMTTATHNLRLKSADAWAQPLPGVYVSQWRDAYDATRAIFLDLIRRVPTDGAPVIIAPNRDHLLVAGSRDETALQAMAGLSVSLWDRGQYSLSMQPFELRGEAWHPFDLQGPLRDEVRKRTMAVRAGDYEAQAAVLARDATNVVPSKLTIVQRKDQSDVSTIAGLVKDVPALLPKAEQIAFIETAERHVTVVWERALAVLGPFEEIEGRWPPLYRVAFPNAEQFERLAAGP